MKKYRLEKEEKEILDAIEKGEWEIIKPRGSEFQHYARIASNTLRKGERMNIRISKADLTRLKAKAAEEGIPYQTLVAGLIHKYVSGALKAA